MSKKASNPPPPGPPPDPNYTSLPGMVESAEPCIMFTQSQLVSMISQNGGGAFGWVKDIKEIPIWYEYAPNTPGKKRGIEEVMEAMEDGWIILEIFEKKYVLGKADK